MTFRPFASNIPTSPSYRPPPDTDPTDGGSDDLLEAADGGLSLPVNHSGINTCTCRRTYMLHNQ